MEDQISDYYKFYTRALLIMHNKTTRNLLAANEELQKAIDINPTDEACVLLIENLILLKEYDKAIKFCLEHQNLKNGDSNFFLAYIYGMLDAVGNAPEIIYQLETTISKNGNENSYLRLATMYSNGIGVEKDISKAIEILTAGLKREKLKNRGKFEFELANLYLVEDDYEKSFNSYTAAAEHGCMEAYTRIALFYKKGLFVEKNLETYIKYLLKYLSEESLLELVEIYNLEEISEKDGFIVDESLCLCAQRYNNPIACIMFAAIHVNRKDISMQLINKYLEIGFAKMKDRKDLDETLVLLKESFGEEYADTIRELAKKYWKIEKHFA